MNLEEFVDVGTEAREALHAGEPVVALESSIVSQGMPFPKNIETAVQVERVVRNYGAVPATVAIMGGRIKIGLVPDQLDHMARAEGIVKASRRDLPVVVSERLDAATTVSSTMICAQLAGIRVFATGGIGGVHRGGERTWDVSADLQELGRTDIAVISAGAKAILDIGRTLEYLETLGVPVIGYGTDDFPAFYTRESGYKVDYRMDAPRQIARMIRAKWQMDLGGGVLVGNPVPEDQAADKDGIERAITRALEEADEQGIHGKEVTPFLLGRVSELTEGQSLVTNIALVKHNAALAAQVAVELAALSKS